jgi:hypothetical protein
MWTPAHYLFLLPFLVIQLITLRTLYILLRRLQFTQAQAPVSMPSMQGV